MTPEDFARELGEVCRLEREQSKDESLCSREMALVLLYLREYVANRATTRGNIQ